MENNQVFKYKYSAKLNKEVERIRRKYLPKEENKLERLRELDSRVQTAGIPQALAIGIIGALVFGIGMCFGLNVFSGANWLAFVFGAIGAVLMIPAYPICKRISNKTKSELAPEILSLSEEIINSKKLMINKTQTFHKKIKNKLTV